MSHGDRFLDSLLPGFLSRASVPFKAGMSREDRFLDSSLKALFFQMPDLLSSAGMSYFVSFLVKTDAGLCTVVRWAVPDVSPGVATEKTPEPFPLAL